MLKKIICELNKILKPRDRLIYWPVAQFTYLFIDSENSDHKRPKKWLIVASCNRAQVTLNYSLSMLVGGRMSA